MKQLPLDRHPLVVDNLNLVHYILQKYEHVHMGNPEYDDYFQEGCIGLILAATRFDESRGFQFSTYASSMIRGQIQRYRRDKGNIIRIPRDIYNGLMKVVQMTSQGMSLEDIEEMTGFTSKQIQECIQLGHVDTLDRNISDDTSKKSAPMYEVVEGSTVDLEEILSMDHITDSVDKVKEELTQDIHRDIWEEYIWALYYGEKLNQQYFADKYDISQAQVSRILRKCKKLFVKALAET